MVKLRSALASLKPEDQITKMTAVKNGLTNNAATFSSLIVPLVDYTAKVDEITANADAIIANDDTATSLRFTRDALLAECRLMYEKNSTSVAGKSGDDASVAILSGYELYSTPASQGALGQVTGLAVTTGDNPGELDAHHNPVTGAGAYEKEVSDNPNTGWAHYSTVTVSNETITNLPSMTKRWVRARAVRGLEQGPWSDPATGLVP